MRLAINQTYVTVGCATHVKTFLSLPLLPSLLIHPLHQLSSCCQLLPLAPPLPSPTPPSTPSSSLPTTMSPLNPSPRFKLVVVTLFDNDDWPNLLPFSDEPYPHSKTLDPYLECAHQNLNPIQTTTNPKLPFPLEP